MARLLNKTDGDFYKTGTGHFGFSAVGVSNLGASEYTLVTFVIDESSSVDSYQKELEACLKSCLESCKQSPRSENLLVRCLTFSNDVREIHGFVELATLTVDSYNGVVQCGGMTALKDSVMDAIEATRVYGKQLADNDFIANAVIFIVTDGDDNRSKIASDASIKDALEQIRKDEKLESINTVLVGVGKDAQIMDYLNTFKTNANLTQFVDIGDANAKKLAKLADFISKSISSSSAALGTGQPSKSLSF